MTHALRSLGKIPADEREALVAQYRLERAAAEKLNAASTEERQDLYAAVYVDFYRELEALGLGSKVEQNNPAQTALLETLLAPFVEGDHTFVEFGAGSGELAEKIAKRVSRVFTVDAVEPDQAPSSENKTDPATKVGVVENVGLSELADKIAPASVDVAFSCHLVEHLHPEDLMLHLDQVRDILVPGGAYLVVTPNRLLGPHDVSKHFSSRASGLHLREYTHWELAKCLRAAGLSSVRALRGIVPAPSEGSVFGLGAAEILLSLLPRSIRLALLDRTGTPPLRALEQVKLIGRKSTG